MLHIECSNSSMCSSRQLNIKSIAELPLNVYCIVKKIQCIIVQFIIHVVQNVGDIVLSRLYFHSHSTVKILSPYYMPTTYAISILFSTAFSRTKEVRILLRESSLVTATSFKGEAILSRLKVLM